MAEKDLTEKILLSYNDVFADIVNGLLFKGNKRVLPEELSDSLVHAQYKDAAGGLHEEERDVCKVWKKCGIEIAMCGIENQSQPFKFMPARVIGYDGASYRGQLLKKPKTLIPVITLVLHFGMGHWEQPKSLKELFRDVPNELSPYINDYKIHVFEIAWLTDEEIDRFTGDFRVVANFFAQKRRTNDNYEPNDPQEIRHVDELIKLLSVMTGDNRYDKMLIERTERRITSMCGVAERLENKGIARGIAQGIAQTVMQAYNNGNSAEQIAMFIGMPLAQVESIVAEKQNEGLEGADV